MDEFCRRCTCGPGPSRGNCDSEIDTLKQSVDADAGRWTAPTNGLLEQFRSVVEELAKLPTGRTLILVSGGFNIEPKREFYRAVSAYLPNAPQFKLDDSRDVEPGLREALKVASERNITNLYDRFARRRHGLSRRRRTNGRQRLGRDQRRRAVFWVPTGNWQC